MNAFEQHVLVWLRDQEDSDADQVVEVGSFGTDWAGDTEGGFHDSFNVHIDYLRVDGTRGYLEVSGVELGSLWEYITTLPLAEPDAYVRT